eukprot:ctg_580.g159
MRRMPMMCSARPATRCTRHYESPNRSVPSAAARVRTTGSSQPKRSDRGPTTRPDRITCAHLTQIFPYLPNRCRDPPHRRRQRPPLARPSDALRSLRAVRHRLERVHRVLADAQESVSRRDRA